MSPNAGSLKQQFFMTDFLLRSADMTANTLNKWYPEDKKTPNALPFKFQTVYDSSGNEVKWEGQVVDTLRTPKEMLNAPMSPYFISVRPQQAHLYGYDGKAHSPIGWVLSQRQLTSPDGDNKNLEVDTSLQHAYWGASVDPSTDQWFRCFRLPRVILLTFFDKLPCKELKLTRNNVFERDAWTCQYCGRRPERHGTDGFQAGPHQRHRHLRGCLQQAIATACATGGRH